MKDGVKWWSPSRCVVQVQDDQHGDISCLKLDIHLKTMVVWRFCRRRGSPILVYGGATCESSPSGAQSRKVVQLEKAKIVIIDLKWIMRKAKVWSWYGFYFTSLMMLVERPGYMIDSRTIKRGSRPSILFVSFVESSNLCIIGIIFIGTYLALIIVWSWCLSYLSWQGQVWGPRTSSPKYPIMVHTTIPRSVCRCP